MDVLVDWFMEPLSVIFITGLLAFVTWLFSTPRSLWLGVLLAAVVGMLWVFSAPVTANAWVRQVESSAESTTGCTSMTADLPVVIPGGSMDAYTESENPYRVLSSDSLLRTFRALDFDTGTNTFLVLGGGKTSRKLSDYMARILYDNGILPSRVMQESQSQSTVDNARNLRTLWPEGQNESIILVTSALHLARATATFEAQGFTVECGVGAGSLYSVSAGWVGYLPYVHSLHKSSNATREWLATQLYRWRGYTHASATAN